MQGYWGLEQITADVVVNGWFATGDGGYLDGFGFLYLTDRIKDMIISGGENIYPIEVEEAFLKHPAVAQCRSLSQVFVSGEALTLPYYRNAGLARWVRELAAKAHHVLAIGSCASWGGITAGGDNPTDACGLQYEDDRIGGLLGADFRSTSGLPVINIAGCPTHPSWVIDTLMALAADGFSADDLDPLNRPRFYADQLVHHGCTRNEYYEFKASAEKPSDLGCMMEHMGCKGTQVHADCNIRPWNGEGSCTRGGYACIACTEPGFQEPGHPFHETPKLAGIPIGLPTDMPKAWFVALASLSKSATPKRVKNNAVADHLVVKPAVRKTRLK